MNLSIICPTYNEAKNIEALTASLNTKDGLQKEIIYVDGGSTDDTREKIRALQQKYDNILLVENPDKYVSMGFNKAFPVSKGRYIAFVGAHAHYSDNYFLKGVDYLKSDECDVVGGTWIQKGRSNVGKAIARCMSSKFGVGGTEFRTEKKKKYVQSVGFAIYKREVFETCGLMDNELIQDQDDEFHYRLYRHGYRILLTPEIYTTYYVRESLATLAKQYFRYGLYKPLVFKKVLSGFQLRHAVPGIFVLYLLSLPIMLLSVWWLLPLLLYLLLDAGITLYFAFRYNTQFYPLLVF